MKAQLAQTLWQISALPEAHRFQQATHRVAEIQARRLRNYLTANHATVFGQRHRFAQIGSVEDFQRWVPLSTYDDYADLIERIAQGESKVLTVEPVQMFELSSGSTAASKLIPYTATLKAEFQAGLAAWIVDLFTCYPDLKRGPAYWSITPLTEGRRATPGGIPIGFDADSAYLGPLGSLIESALAVPNLVKHIRDVATFRYITLLFLLKQSNLRLISIWNPTFLTLLLAPMTGWWAALLTDIANGTLTPPGSPDPALHAQLQRKLRPDVHRAQRLAALQPTDYASIWPSLRLVSCWADGPADSYAHKLQSQFPTITFQPKGLLATEAFVSFPLNGQTGTVLAVTSHFFEFITDSGQVRLAHQLALGGTYAVVVTTGGGLYRYQLQDTVEIVGFVGEMPCLKFLGKTNQFSDWFGEKLSEQFVANVLSKLFEDYRLTPDFALLTPDEIAGEFRYTLYLEIDSGRAVEELGERLDQALRTNFHYNYCRQLGQLAQTQVTLIRNGTETYTRVCQQRGQKLGNIKPSVLQNGLGWRDWFTAATADRSEATQLMVKELL